MALSTGRIRNKARQLKSSQKTHKYSKNETSNKFSCCCFCFFKESGVLKLVFLEELLKIFLQIGPTKDKRTIKNYFH